MKTSAHPQGVQHTTNSSDASEGANATAVAASGSFKSATAVHLMRLPSRGCHILTYLHNSRLSPRGWTSKRPLNRLIPRCGREDLPVGCPSPIPNYPGVRFVHRDRYISYGYKSVRVRGPAPLWIRGIKVRRTGFFFLAEQAPGSVTGDGQDELVVRTERDPRHGERVAFEWLAEWPERFRIVDPNCGVLRGCGFTCCCEQLAGRGDGYGN